MIKPWQTNSIKLVIQHRIFDLFEVKRMSPRTAVEHDFIVMKCPNWVNVIAVTPENQLVMVEQYRHGSDTIELEIPGGVIDQKDHNPIEAGLRELQEETGYSGEKARIISDIYPNPAIMSNSCYTVLVENCKCLHGLNLDHGEDIATRLVPVEDIPRLVYEGAIKHSLVLVALYRFDILMRCGRTSMQASGTK